MTSSTEATIERCRRQWAAYSERQRAKRIKRAAYHLQSLIEARQFIAVNGIKHEFMPEEPAAIACLGEKEKQPA